MTRLIINSQKFKDMLQNLLQKFKGQSPLKDAKLDLLMDVHFLGMENDEEIRLQDAKKLMDKIESLEISRKGRP